MGAPASEPQALRCRGRPVATFSPVDLSRSQRSYPVARCSNHAADNRPAHSGRAAQGGRRRGSCGFELETCGSGSRHANAAGLGYGRVAGGPATQPGCTAQTAARRRHPGHLGQRVDLGGVTNVPLIQVTTPAPLVVSSCSTGYLQRVRAREQTRLSPHSRRPGCVESPGGDFFAHATAPHTRGNAQGGRLVSYPRHDESKRDRSTHSGEMWRD